MINWQTGTPIGFCVTCIVTLDNGIVTTDTFGFEGWNHYQEKEIIAWCPLRDIEPYKCS